MSTRTLLNLGLLALVAILSLLVIFEPGKEAPRENTPITTLKVDQISTIHVKRPKMEAIEFKRREGHWWMTSPLEIPANEYRMERLLSVAEARSLAHYPANGVVLEPLGLQTPTVRLQLNNHVLSFGTTEKLNHLRYVLIDDAIHMLQDTAYYHLIGDYTTFISTQLLAPAVKLTALQLPGFTLQQDQAQWHIDPQPENYSADSVVALVDAWRHAQAVEIKAYSGDGLGEKIILMLTEQQALEFEIIQQTPDFILGRADLGIEYHLSESTAETLLKLKDVAAKSDLVKTQPE